MPGVDEVADSTDWLDTPLSGLAPLESGLRCQVCKDFFTTPMITSCSHSFCSLCIRRYLSQEGKCPACRESDQELKLRRNWALEELVSHFTQSRDQILAIARQSAPHADESPRPRKRRKIEPTTNGTGRRSTRSQSKRQAASQVSEPASSQVEVVDSEEEGSVYEDESHSKAQPKNEEPHDGLVSCPCCHRRMKEASINTHLDRCIQGLPTSPEPPPTTQPVTNSASLAFAQRTKSPTVTVQKDRLPSINYALYTETSLRKKLKELGIPNHGNKELMRKRHIEWMNLWNANCDSSRPKTKRELLKELDVWERTLGRQMDRNVTSTTSGVMVKDFDRDGWVKSQKGEFDDLIKKAREQRKAVVVAAEKAEGQDMNMTDGDNAGRNVSGEQHQQHDQQDTNATGQASIPATEVANPITSEISQPEHERPSEQSPPISNGLPLTPLKNGPGVQGDTASAIDLTSSPAVAQGEPTREIPRMQRSKFFT